MIVFRALQFYIHTGETVCFTGQEHSGKSLLLKMMLGYTHPTSGMVLFRHKNWASLNSSEHHHLYKSIGVMGSPSTLLPDQTVYDALVLPLVVRGYTGKSLDNRVRSTLLNLELYDRSNEVIHTLSYHEQFRLNLGRAFIHRPALVVADTPLSWFKEKESVFWEWVERLRSPETTFICTETLPMTSVDRVYALASEQWMPSQA